MGRGARPRQTACGGCPGWSLGGAQAGSGTPSPHFPGLTSRLRESETRRLTVPGPTVHPGAAGPPGEARGASSPPLPACGGSRWARLWPVCPVSPTHTQDSLTGRGQAQRPHCGRRPPGRLSFQRGLHPVPSAQGEHLAELRGARSSPFSGVPGGRGPELRGRAGEGAATGLLKPQRPGPRFHRPPGGTLAEPLTPRTGFLQERPGSCWEMGCPPEAIGALGANVPLAWSRCSGHHAALSEWSRKGGSWVPPSRHGGGRGPAATLTKPPHSPPQIGGGSPHRLPALR